MDAKDRNLTIREAAEVLGFSPHTVRSWIARRQLAHLRIGRSIRVPASEIRRLLTAAMVPVERSADGG
jgi:excisionase family DNA binding protein